MSTNDGTAEGRSLGPALRLRDAPIHELTRGRLRTLAWETVSHGLYAPLDPQRSSLDQARALTHVLPRESGFGHLTSARLRGWWLPHRLDSHVCLATTTSAVHIQRRGLYVRRSRHAEFDDLDGVPVVSVAQTLVALARDLSLLDLVPMIDCALRTETAPQDILAAARPRVPGANRLRRALPLADPLSESRVRAWWKGARRPR
ncbi:MAG TPA: hypothetical protein VNP20_25195 [Nocardioidaceae bacterium]|nr:hypothetical protein [Nocardioidaceae bacterium]